ncbi:nuclear receptor coactivator 7 isoform X2 [Sardina pilchardus]|uniref:nuclear receptor coactivator 7 isoform X2 n=1 Tax=Sardina pilchardus TaxID=27697 RepID=UPI002E0F7F53
MDKKEKRPGYFARLKKRRQLKQSQSESSVNGQDQSDADQRGPIISEQQEKGQKEEHEKRKELNGDTHTDNGSNPISQVRKEKQRPPGTVEYTVGSSDTLNSISLQFNITPNELVQLNRLFSRSVVPGQKLFVPDIGQSDSGCQETRSDPNQSSAAPGKPSQDGEVSGPAALLLRRELSPPSEDESPATVKFIKMSCKYFTDGMGVVGGVMIVTPNNIMFDPHKSDPLVIEHGCEEYGLICPLQELVCAALYHDVSRMKIKDALPSPGEWEELPSERDLNPFSRYEELERQRRHGHAPPLHQRRHGDAPPLHQTPSDEGFTELEPLGGSAEEEEEEEEEEQAMRSSEEITCTPRAASQVGVGQVTMVTEAVGDAASGRTRSEASTVGGATEPAAQAGDPRGNQGHCGRCSSPQEEEGLDEDQGHCGRCSSPQEEEGLDEDQGHCGRCSSPQKQEEEELAEDQGHCGRCSSPQEEEGLDEDQGHCGRCSSLQEELTEEEKRRRRHKAEVKSWLLQRMQGPIENMLLSAEEKSKAPPMFLCFKVGRPMRKSFAVAQATSPTHSSSRRAKLSEYWFAVPQERVDDLYSFLVQWSPEAYGKEAREQGFIVVEKDELNMIDNFFSEVPRSWEIITINEAKRRQSFGSFEEEEPLDLLPCLSDPSALLDDTHIQKLAARLPARVQGYPWRLAYSTGVHGTSLKTLYRNLGDLDCPVLLTIKDMDNQVFGAFSTHPFRVSEHCYGTGETFLYSFSPEIKVYHWTGENSYFVKGNIDSLQLGGGGGGLGLWLDADLYHGTTSSCSTFSNQPLSAQQDFTVHSLEVWAFD